jgi:hypothetical protein
LEAVLSLFYCYCEAVFCQWRRFYQSDSEARVTVTVKHEIADASTDVRRVPRASRSSVTQPTTTISLSSSFRRRFLPPPPLSEPPSPSARLLLPPRAFCALLSESADPLGSPVRSACGLRQKNPTRGAEGRAPPPLSSLEQMVLPRRQGADPWRAPRRSTSLARRATRLFQRRARKGARAVLSRRRQQQATREKRTRPRRETSTSVDRERPPACPRRALRSLVAAGRGKREREREKGRERGGCAQRPTGRGGAWLSTARSAPTVGAKCAGTDRSRLTCTGTDSVPAHISG